MEVFGVPAHAEKLARYRHNWLISGSHRGNQDVRHRGKRVMWVVLTQVFVPLTGGCFDEFWAEKPRNVTRESCDVRFGFGADSFTMWEPWSVCVCSFFPEPLESPDFDIPGRLGPRITESTSPRSNIK